MCKVTTTFRAARRVATPLLAVQTPDPAKTIRAIVDSISQESPPMFTFNLASGMGYANEAGKNALSSFASEPQLLTNPSEVVCDICPKLPAGAVLFCLNAQRYIDKPDVAQGLWNLRDQFKLNKRMIVLLAPTLKLPPELAQDVLVIDEPLPNEHEMREIVETIHADASLPAPDEVTIQHAISAVSGLAAFPAEQAVAMSLSKTGLNVAELWERKRQLISQTEGLSVWREGQTFEDIAGYANVKGFMNRMLAGRTPPRCIVFIDEIEKHLGSTEGDTSGVKRAMSGTLLTWLQDNRARGNIFIGPGGSGKSAVAKAVGNEAGIPTIAFDLSQMQNSLVGASEATLREALKVIDAVGQGHSYWVATCNKISALSPELRRRFNSGTFFFDLPSAAERDAIWQLYLAKYDLLGQLLERPNDFGWTGAEIRSCVEMAYDFRCSLIDASAYIVPLAVSARESVEALRAQAHGTFIDASHPGYYDRNRNDAQMGGSGSARSISLED